MEKILHLNLKKEYFDDIKNGAKDFEYRLYNDYWKKRLVGKDYDLIYIKCGYPKKNDKDKILKFKYRGYFVGNIFHKEFGSYKVKVFAIQLRK